MRKLAVLTMSLCLLVLTAAGAFAAEAPPAAEDAELRAGDWTTLAKRYAMPYYAPDGQESAPPSAELLAKWWETLGDETLTELIALSLENNRDIVSARSRVTEARAALGISKAALLPWLDNSNSLSRARTGANSSATGASVGPIDYYSLGIDASWEIDVFGGRHHRINASRADLQTRYGMLYNTWVSLSSEVAVDYISLRTLQKRLRVAEKNLALQKETLELLQSQYDSGLNDELALSQARYTLEQTRSTIPPLRAGIEKMMNLLAILVGQVPGSLEETLGEYRPLPEPEAVNLAGIPANALRRRPDIYTAEWQLIAQTERKEAAKRDLWPRFFLLGALEFAASSSTSGIFSSEGTNYSFGPGISIPIFHGTEIRNNIKVQTAKQEQALAAYEQTVLQAVAEVRDALTAETQERQRNASLQRGLEAAIDAYEVAQDQYMHGLTDFSNVIDAQSARLQLEEQYAISEGEMISNIIRIFKALGGGWEPLTPDNIPRPAPAKDTVKPQLSDESQAYLDQLRSELDSKKE